MAIATLIVVTLLGGFFLAYLEHPLSTPLGGVALIVAGFMIKTLQDHLVARRKGKEKGIVQLKSLLAECRENLELIKSRRIVWPQVHFKTDSFASAKETAVLKILPQMVFSELSEVYRLISEIERRKFSAHNEATEMMLEKLAERLRRTIEEIEERIPN